MQPSSDGPDPDDFVTPIDKLEQRVKAELARLRRIALTRRDCLLKEIASIEDEYGLPRTKPARHKEF